MAKRTPGPAVPAAPGHRTPASRGFAALCVASGLAAAGFTLWLALRVGGQATTAAVDDYSETLAALLAAAAAGFAVRR